MKKEQVWEAYCKKNPGFESDNSTFTPQGLRKLFDQTWDLAYKSGMNGDMSDDYDEPEEPGRKPMSDKEAFDLLNGTLFGNKL